TIEEEVLANHLKELGPPICIGRPGERFPRAGFHRLYVPNEAWHQQVIALLGDARCVIFVQGTTEGLAWELRTIATMLPPLRLLWLVGLRQYAGMKELAEGQLPQSLPPLSSFYRGIRFHSTDVGAIMFGEDWRAIALPILVKQVDGNAWWYHKITFTRPAM